MITKPKANKLIASSSFLGSIIAKSYLALTVDPNIAVSFLNEKYKWDNKIKIYTIWIWKDEETYISIKNVMWFTQKVAIEWVDEETLKQIAKLSNWKYYRAENKESLRKIFDNISELEKTDIEIDSITEIKSISKYFIYILLFIFVIFIY